MKQACRLSARLVLTLLLAAAFVGSALEAPGQPPKPVSSERRNPPKDFNKEGRDEYKALQSMRKGETPPNKEILDRAAQWLLYRLTHIEYQDGSARSTTGASTSSTIDLVNQANSFILVPEGGKPLSTAQQEYMKVFGKCLVARGREVLRDPMPIVRISALMILDRLAESGQEEAADAFLDVIKNENDREGLAVKLWAFRGLSELLNSARGPNAIKIEKERETRIVQALIAAIGKKWPVSENASTEEKEAIPYVRREAIRALGLTRYPAIEIVGKDKKKIIESPTALVLLRILSKEGVDPPPSIGEEVEAAIGVLQLNPKLMPDYNTDFAVHSVGRFYVEFANRCLTERGDNIREPWKKNAARLIQAMNDLKTEMDSAQIPVVMRQFVNNFVAQSTPMLDDLAGGRSTNPTAFNGWLDTNQAKSNTVYKGMAASTLKTGGPAQ